MAPTARRIPDAPTAWCRAPSAAVGLLVLALALAATPPGPGAAEPTRERAARPAAAPRAGVHVTADGPALRVELREARPTEAIEALGARGAVPVTVQGELPGRITRTFTAASLEAAVREVLRGYAAVVVLTREGDGRGDRVSAIRILALGSAPPAGDPAPPVPSAPPAPGTPAARLEPAPAGRRPGHPRGPVAELGQALIEDGDAVARALAATPRRPSASEGSPAPAPPAGDGDEWSHPAIAGGLTRLLEVTP